ncbi:TPA: rod shape-determining protein RodA [Candidatus Collierbacteria bacterium]|uniref:Rod shape-determining protein RodA n=1 Tax=Candidatus Collierbacteria bacterium GW2011_GWB2_44_22 TaxID=1618387 RepID=A0A0G1HWX6_9BACT|nr:MAG: Rod shape-determining protein RodA [Candidatus Collierbacteria bacterium GW2011_GWB1_44_197]KKT51591.1 MAG: Rod shape-determining protein RodA [Candidatus Collierbacteria bacterium GW2011_GWB2_44_22]KKT63042.1 MAG: Rod shape-determining protein RodA [Candidatus Collierbacteria bacterium GW2011_GWD1_44_27]KKT66443.1 MAG: Rod shape-determining protein RodA [Candidatus Collierbacteria bacterium GW2011_GWC2_44_30]KKT68695.1 MAG: Rod shape-determining protein RodA [Microgenomates group bacte
MRQNKGLLFAALVLIEVLSLVTLWSTVPDLFMSQLAFVVAGAIIIYLLGKSDIVLLLTLGKTFYIVSIVLLLITMVVGRNIRGSVRWIDLGFFNLQTSEIIKPLLAISYSAYISNLKKINWRQLLIFLCLAFIPVALVAIQPDLGSALTLVFLPVAILVVSGQINKLLVLGAVCIALVLPLEARLLKPYQRQRLETFINPYTDPKGAGYNVIQSTIAVGSGKIFGKGVKLGTQSHLNFLPERHTDFIFASYVEEFGFVGALVLFLSYFVIFRFCLYGIERLHDRQQNLLSLSIFFLFLFQFVVNVGMNLGIMPVTGITLPLFSYGGSSLLSFAILVGLLCRQLDLITPFEI